MFEIAGFILVALFYGWVFLFATFLISFIFNLRRILEKLGDFILDIYAPAFLAGSVLALILWRLGTR